ncbi:MAG TPA: winged helix DNA-binding domain-containing protein, partial [Ktedonobacteraceae bacterium]
MSIFRLTSSNIAASRLHNQHLAGPRFERVEDVVQWLGAVQAQEYAGATWGIAQRARDLTSALLAQAFAEGKILRTHLLRPTWHFVVPADIYWMLELTAPRVHALNAYYYRQFELDDELFAKSYSVLTKALQGGKQLTRQELAKILADSGITASGLRLAYIFMHAELDVLICSGALRGKQQTYALLSERVAQAKTCSHEAALAELARRYFTSHGPATLK